MKELTKYNRVANFLNKLFDMLNSEFFENELSKPTITIQSSPKAHGHFSLSKDSWISKNGNTHEINIGAGSLGRPIEEVVATLLHEMVHYYNFEHKVSDCSRGGTYHNRKFKEAAEAHGLIVRRSDKYGWGHTEPSDVLLDFVLENDLPDIQIYRNEKKPSKPKKSSSRKYICPCCDISVRATKEVCIACVNCSRIMMLQSKNT